MTAPRTEAGQALLALGWTSDGYPLDSDDLAAIEAEAAALDVDRLDLAIRVAFHKLRWCRWSDHDHAVAHDDEDEDGYRSALTTAIAAAYAEETE